MHLKYKSVRNFVLNENFEFCKPYSFSLHNSVKSKDGNFIAYIEHYYTEIVLTFTDDTPPDSAVIAYNKYYNDLMNMAPGVKNDYLTGIYERNSRSFSKISYHLIDLAGKYDPDSRSYFSMKDLKKNVQYLPNKYAKSQFNADTVILYSLPVKPVNGDKKFQEKYSHCEVLMMQKNDLGPVFLYCFYSDEGYKNREKYFKKMEKAIGFKN